MVIQSEYIYIKKSNLYFQHKKGYIMLYVTKGKENKNGGTKSCKIEKGVF